MGFLAVAALVEMPLGRGFLDGVVDGFRDAVGGFLRGPTLLAGGMGVAMLEVLEVGVSRGGDYAMDTVLVGFDEERDSFRWNVLDDVNL